MAKAKTPVKYGSSLAYPANPTAWYKTDYQLPLLYQQGLGAMPSNAYGSGPVDTWGGYYKTAIPQAQMTLPAPATAPQPYRPAPGPGSGSGPAIPKWAPPPGSRPEDVPERAAYAATIGQNSDLARKIGASQLSYLAGRVGPYGWTGANGGTPIMTNGQGLELMRALMAEANKRGRENREAAQVFDAKPREALPPPQHGAQGDDQINSPPEFSPPNAGKASGKQPQGEVAPRFKKASGGRVKGSGTGRSDDVGVKLKGGGKVLQGAKLSNDEYVVPADVVAAMGEGSSEAGADALDNMVMQTRANWTQKLASLPPPSRGDNHKLFGGLFGGQSQKVEPKLPEYLKAFQGPIQGIGKAVLDQAPGNTVAGFSPDTLASFNAQRNIALKDPTGYFKTMQQAGKPLDTAAITSRMNPFTSTVTANTLRDFDKSATQDANQRDLERAGRSAFGIRRDLAENDEQRQTQDARGSLLAGLNKTGFDEAQTQANTDVNRSMGVATDTRNTAIANANLLGGIGGQYENKQQQVLDAPARQLGIASGLISGQATGSSTSGGGGSILGQIAGLGLAGAGVYNAFGRKDGGSFADGGAVDSDPRAIFEKVVRGDGDPRQLLDRYRQLTGKALDPSLWGSGYGMSDGPAALPAPGGEDGPAMHGAPPSGPGLPPPGAAPPSGPGRTEMKAMPGARAPMASMPPAGGPPVGAGIPIPGLPPPMGVGQGAPPPVTPWEAGRIPSIDERYSGPANNPLEDIRQALAPRPQAPPQVGLGMAPEQPSDAMTFTDYLGKLWGMVPSSGPPGAGAQPAPEVAPGAGAAATSGTNAPVVDIRKPGSLQARINHELDAPIPVPRPDRSIPAMPAGAAPPPMGGPGILPPPSVSPAAAAPAAAATAAPTDAEAPGFLERWLSNPLTDLGFRMMASQNPNFLGAVGEAGSGASQDLIRRNYIKEEQKRRDAAEKRQAAQDAQTERHQTTQEHLSQEQIDAMRDWRRVQGEAAMAKTAHEAEMDKSLISLREAQRQRALRGPQAKPDKPFDPGLEITKASIAQLTKIAYGSDPLVSDEQRQAAQQQLAVIGAGQQLPEPGFQARP